MSNLVFQQVITASIFTVSSYFARDRTALYIPLFQRGYAWDSKNIDQLFEGILSGMRFLITTNNQSAELRFFGTIITSKVLNNNQIFPLDQAAIPTRIDTIIDGQQRLSTLALLATALYQRLRHYQLELERYQNGLDDHNNTSQIRELIGVCHVFTKRLTEIFSLDFNFGTPQRKPRIIRALVDKWTREGIDWYKSDVAQYLAKCCESLPPSNQAWPTEAHSVLVKNNVSHMYSLLHILENAPISETHPSGKDLLDRYPTTELLCSNIPLKAWLQTFDWPQLGSLIRLFAFTAFVLDRSALAVIETANAVAAFDIFQSLNTTGTPLTALDTFKATVTELAEKHDGGYHSSKAEEVFNKASALWASRKSHEARSGVASGLITSFAVAYEGFKLGKHFGEQQRWLSEKYPQDSRAGSERATMIQYLGDLVDYILLTKTPQVSVFQRIAATPAHAELTKEALISLRYLNDANHQMSQPVLARFFSETRIRPQDDNIVVEFAEAIRAVTAFFTLWRAAKSTSGLDTAYRKIMKRIGWHVAHNHTPVFMLKKLLKEELAEAELVDMNSSQSSYALWFHHAQTELRYTTSSHLCRFALVVAAHDTIADNVNGLMTPGAHGCAEYLSPDRWDAKDLKSIEHIAPQEGSNGWPPDLYPDLVDTIGNLTLLPTPINSGVGNKSWKQKWYYYKYLAERNLQARRTLVNTAALDSVALESSTLSMLNRARYAHHIESIVTVNKNAKWDSTIVKQRTERICEILWNRMWQWLN